MTAVARDLAGRRLIAAALLGATAAALGLRLAVAGPRLAASPVAGVVFGLVLLGLCVARPPRVTFGRRDVGIGLLGAAMICAPALLRQLLDPGPVLALNGLPVWAAVVALVAVAEEAVLRGSMFEALAQGWNEATAIAVTTIAFALIHVPLYGWKAFPIDLAVGYLLGVLRAHSGSATAPAVAHTTADLAGWWLR